MRFPEHLKSFDEIAADSQPEALGTVGDIRTVIENAIGDIEWDTSGWGRGTGPGFSGKDWRNGPPPQMCG